MSTQPLSDAVLNDTTGFPDAPATEGQQAVEGGDDALQLTADQALDDSLANDEGGEQEPGASKQETENPVEKRIKGALKARDDARNLAANREAENAELKARLAAIEARLTPANDGAATETAEPAPNPENYEFGSLDQKYIDDVVSYRSKLAVKEALGQIEKTYEQKQVEAAQRAQAEQAINAAKDIVAKGAALYDDFEEVVWERGLRQEYPMTQETFQALQAADHPAEIAYALASDLTEAARVAAMTPGQQAKYVFQKDQELSVKPPRVTKAAPPPGQQTRGAAGRYSVAGDTDDLDAFSKEFFAKKH